MSEHLNTPWTYDNDSGRIEGQHENPKMGSVHIADIRGWGYLTGLTEGYALGLSEAKALEVQRRRGELIAAAPDLLASLKNARFLIGKLAGGNGVGLNELDEEYSGMVAGIEAAIARAEGGAE